MSEAHFLRPALTKHIIQRLQRGESLNLFGKTGIGKTRMIEDVRNASLDKTVVIIVSFRAYEHSYEGFCEAIWDKANQKGTVPKSLNEIIEALKQSKKRIFLFIKDFDYLFENQNLDPQYDLKFINALNSIINSPGSSLLVVTKVFVRNMLIITRQQQFTSPLIIEPVEISPLPFLEVQAELNRRFKNMLSDEQIVFLTSHLNEHENAYELLEHYEPRILEKEDIQLKFEDRLKKWLKMFEQRKHDSLKKQAGKSLDQAEIWGGFFNRLRKLLIPFESILNVLKKASGDVFSWIISSLKKGN